MPMKILFCSANAAIWELPRQGLKKIAYLQNWSEWVARVYVVI